jgi:hypothetical protein
MLLRAWHRSGRASIQSSKVVVSRRRRLSSRYAVKAMSRQ